MGCHIASSKIKTYLCVSADNKIEILERKSYGCQHWLLSVEERTLCRPPTYFLYTRITQLVECFLDVEEVVSSSLAVSTNLYD